MKNGDVKMIESRPLEYWYDKALHNKEIHMCTNMNLDKYNIKSLFEDKNAKKFIKEYFGYLRVNGRKQGPAKKFLDLIDDLTDFRSKHTVASFLLGIALKEELSFDIRKSIRIKDTKSPDPSFGFFWSLICLTHDVAYKIEDNSNIYLEDARTLEKFIKWKNIKYKLYEKSDKRNLIEKYYKYRIINHKKIDHGIVAAFLLYDALMTFYYEGKNLSESEICGVKIKSNKFEDYCLKIVETVACHNMWRAEIKKEDNDKINKEKKEKSQCEIYANFELNELIPNKNESEKVFYKDDSLLFLLGLIDTIDPMKFFCFSEHKKERISAELVLDNLNIEFIKSGRLKNFILDFDHFELRDKRYKEKLEETELWLGIKIAKLFNNDNVIKLHIRTQDVVCWKYNNY